MSLNAKQERFVQEYLIDLNATQAAIRAGYSPRSAKVNGSRMLTNADVAEAISKGRQQVAAGALVTRERVLQELTNIGTSDVRRLYDENGNLRPIHTLDDATAASIAGVETDEIIAGGNVIGHTRKVKRFDKTKALELLGRHLGLWEDQEKPANVGPGLTVVVQQVGQNGQQTVAQRIDVRLPGPRAA